MSSAGHDLAQHQVWELCTETLVWQLRCHPQGQGSRSRLSPPSGLGSPVIPVLVFSPHVRTPLCLPLGRKLICSPRLLLPCGGIARVGGWGCGDDPSVGKPGRGRCRAASPHQQSVLEKMRFPPVPRVVGSCAELCSNGRCLCTLV